MVNPILSSEFYNHYNYHVKNNRRGKRKMFIIDGQEYEEENPGKKISKVTEIPTALLLPGDTIKLSYSRGYEGQDKEVVYEKTLEAQQEMAVDFKVISYDDYSYECNHSVTNVKKV